MLISKKSGLTGKKLFEKTGFTNVNRKYTEY